MSAATPVRILAVDDDPGLLRVLERVLSPRYEVSCAGTVAQALEKLEAESFDIAILDVVMPDGDGYRLNRALRDRWPDTDVILMTGSTSQQDQKLFQALDDDAFYFLFKPFHRRVLTALVERCLRIRSLNEENRQHLDRLAADQAKAREIQRQLLPRTPVQVGRWRVEARFEPCETVSGDLFTVLPTEDGGLVVAVVDVIGHGLPAAMYAGMLRATLDAARRLDPDPENVFCRLFAGLDFFALNSGASMFYGLLSPGGHLRYFSAGHPEVLVCRSQSFDCLGSTGPILSPAAPIALLPRSTGEVQLGESDRLFIYTDGLVEAMSPEGEAFELDGVEAALREVGQGTVAESLDGVVDALHRHKAGRPLEDDVTIVLVERRG